MRPRRTRAQMEAEDEEDKDDLPVNSAVQRPSHIKRPRLNAGATPMIGTPPVVNEDEEEKKEEISPVVFGSERAELPELSSELSISAAQESAAA